MSNTSKIKILILGILWLPYVKVSGALPQVRPDWIIVCLGIFFSGNIINNNTKSIIGTSIVLLTSISFSMLYGLANLGIQFLLRDIYEIFKPIIYTLTFIYVINSKLELYRVKKILIFILYNLTLISIFAITQYYLPGPLDFITYIYVEETQLNSFAGARVTGTMANPNDFGLLMVFGLALAFYNSTINKKYKILNILLIIILLTGIIVSGSRTCFILGAIIIILYTIKFINVRLQYSKATVVSLIIILLGILYISVNSQSILIRQLELLGKLSEIKAWESRVYGVIETFKVISEHWIIGHGPAKEEFIGGNIDNEYIVILFRYGIIGLIMHMLYIYSIVKKNVFFSERKFIFQNNEIGYLLFVLLLSSALFAYTAGIFLSFRLFPFFIVIFGLTTFERDCK
tara:strand:+ start:995 stop:2200 length:1206 start_codon:yes stop_codon:yes gene_type:complete